MTILEKCSKCGSYLYQCRCGNDDLLNSLRTFEYKPDIILPPPPPPVYIPPPMPPMPTYGPPHSSPAAWMPGFKPMRPF